jgi:hypothetical protein
MMGAVERAFDPAVDGCHGAWALVRIVGMSAPENARLWPDKPWP